MTEIRARFRVPPDAEGGVVRAGFGAFVEGQEFDWPLNPKPGDNPSLSWIPANAEATAILIKTCQLKIEHEHPQKDAAVELLEQIALAEKSGIPYHAWLLNKEAAANAVVPPEDRDPAGDPSLPPEDRATGGKGSKGGAKPRTSDSK